VCLGLITNKTPELEGKEEVIARIKENAKIVPLEERLKFERTINLGLRPRSMGEIRYDHIYLMYQGDPMMEKAK
jgi:methionine synthase II (cobalamin-independent)